MKLGITITALLTVTILVAIVFLVNVYNCGRHPTTENYGLGMLLIIIAMVVIIVDSIAISTLWKSYKVFALTPLLTILGSCAVSMHVGTLGFKTRINDFKINHSAYDEIVSKVVSREIPNPVIHEIRSLKSNTNYVAFRTPTEYQKLVPYLITADYEGTNTIAVRLVLCMMFPSHHRAYLWCPDGQFEKRLRVWEHISERISDKWCAISD